MSVYTVLNQNDLEKLLKNYPVNQLLSFSEITDGIENSNYLLRCQNDSGDALGFVLTVFEKIDLRQLRIFVDLLSTLSAQGLPVPAPIKQNNGVYIALVQNKPYMLCPLLEGGHIDEPSESHCQQIGKALAEVHLSSKHFDCSKLLSTAEGWWRNFGTGIEAELNDEELAVYKEEIALFDSIETKLNTLPKGIIHTDLFLDNTLFQEDKLSAMLDFYDATHDMFLYDLAVVANDWCKQEDGILNTGKLSSLINAYESVRPLNETEKELWNGVLRLATFRYWVSRKIYHQMLATNNIQAKANPKKNPDEFFNILKQHKNTSA